MRQEKITFTDVYKDFRMRLPNLSKGVSHWRPVGYLSIQVFFGDGSEMVYDYLDKRAAFKILPRVIG